MEEIKALLAQWEEEGTASGAGVEKAYLILELLVAKVEQLDAQLNG
jgi:hypothetical protein